MFRPIPKLSFTKYSKLTLNTYRCLSKLGNTFNQIPSSLQPQQHQQHQDYQHKLKTSFNQLTKLIPFVSSSATKTENGLFGNTGLSSYEGFYSLKENAELKVNRLIKEAFEAETPSKRKLVEIFDDISNELCCVADLAEFVRTSHPDAKYRQAADSTFGQISQIVETLNTNLELYLKLKESIESDELSSKMDDCDKRVCRLFLADFEQSGIHLDKPTRNKFVNLNDQLVNTLMKFQINSQQPSLLNSSEIDSKYRNIVKYFRDPIQVDTMFINSDDELIREFVYKSYLQENKVQESYFRSILTQRKQLANLCGFETYSHRANLNMLMDRPEQVLEFLNECSKSVHSRANKDLNKMRDYKKKTLKSDSPLMHWDVPIISARLKKDMFDLDRSHYSNYFSLGSCMEGLNLIMNSLYNVNLEVIELEPGETWHQDIYKLAVKDTKQASLLGYIFCDFYMRPDKFANVDCHFTIQCSKQLKNEKFQTPVVVLHLNFGAPSKDRPTLLSFEMMENLFHEFGHAMHSMFAKTRYQHVSGTRCSTDFAEVPSQLMEFYCRDPRVLKLFAKHYQTQEVLDDRTIHKLCESKKLFASCDLQTQILNSVLDQAFHLTDFDNPDVKTCDLIRKYTGEYHSLPYVENTHWHLRYTHLVGYGAKYHSYLISKAIASNIWSDCFEKDPLSSTAGQNYRKKMLEFGGEKRPEELIKSLIGLDVKTSSLVNSLTKNL